MYKCPWMSHLAAPGHCFLFSKVRSLNRKFSKVLPGQMVCDSSMLCLTLCEEKFFPHYTTAIVGIFMKALFNCSRSFPKGTLENDGRQGSLEMSSIMTFHWRSQTQDPETGEAMVKVTQQANERTRATIQGSWLTTHFFPAPKV
jgi:hypothetical protein